MEPPAGQRSIGTGGPLSVSFVAKSRVALSIEGSCLRVVGDRGRHAELWLDVPPGNRLMQQGQVSDPDRLGQSIAVILANRNIFTSSVICGLSGARCVSRLFTLPRAKGPARPRWWSARPDG